MSKHKKHPMIDALKAGQSFTWTQPDGSDFASMRKAVKHGQTLTISPITDYHEVQVGDIVCVKWHGWYMTHLVQEIQGEQFLIANSVGKINGWVHGNDVLGRVTKIVDPEPRPSVEEMLELLEISYRKLIDQQQATTIEADKLLAIAVGMRWYAERLGPERWLKQPKSNKWSFEQDLWYLAKRAGRSDRDVDQTGHVLD